jgi:uncharacterized protein with HEPN domain
MRPESAALLWDVRAAAERIGTFVSGLTEASYREDELRKSAVERQLEVLGEALKNLRSADPDTAATIPDVSRIIGMRNVLAHAYAVVDDRVVWEAATARVPALVIIVDGLLADAK